MGKAWQHLKTINAHKLRVMVGCFKIGLIKQGLLHDLSKYSPTEFLVGAKFYLGTKSPNTAEREQNGYSLGWMHHKGRNKHHVEYWTDIAPGTREYKPVPMPRKYVAEMCIDRIAACKTYLGKKYNDAAAIDYLNKSKEHSLMHEDTRRDLVFILELLRDMGEKEAFKYIRKYYKNEV